MFLRDFIAWWKPQQIKFVWIGFSLICSHILPKVHLGFHKTLKASRACIISFNKFFRNNVSLILKSYYVCSSAAWIRCILMKQSVNNDVSKDSPFGSLLICSWGLIVANVMFSSKFVYWRGCFCVAISLQAAISKRELHPLPERKV